MVSRSTKLSDRVPTFSAGCGFIGSQYAHKTVGKTHITTSHSRGIKDMVVSAPPSFAQAPGTAYKFITESAYVDLDIFRYRDAVGRSSNGTNSYNLGSTY